LEHVSNEFFKAMERIGDIAMGREDSLEFDR